MQKDKKPFVDFRAIRSRITMEQVLEHYQVLGTLKRSGNRLSGPCPIHNGNNPTQFRVDTEKNIWNCFSECKQYVCTACRNKIPVVDLEDFFLDELKGYLVSPEKVEAYLSQANQTVAEKINLLESLTKELQRVKQEAEQTHKLYLAGALSIPQFKEIYQPLDERKHQLEDQEIPRVTGEVDLLRINGLSREHIMTEGQNLHTRWPKLPHDARLKLVEMLVREITVGKNEIEINLYYLPGFEEMTNRQRML